MSETEHLIEEIKTLPDYYAAEVLNFVGYLKEKDAKYKTDCPICARHRDPKTGELRFNAETLAAFEEGDAILRGERPAKWHTSLEDLDKMLGL